MSLWPNTTDLVIGAETDTSTYPSNPNATLQESYFMYVPPYCFACTPGLIQISLLARGRTIRKIDFSSTGLAIGGFAAVDFFGDGSFYLLNVPGVSPPS
jgi:hypothetical protein